MYRQQRSWNRRHRERHDDRRDVREDINDKFAYVTSPSDPVDCDLQHRLPWRAAGARQRPVPVTRFRAIRNGVRASEALRLSVANGAAATLSVLSVNENNGAATTTVPTGAAVYYLAGSGGQISIRLPRFLGSWSVPTRSIRRTGRCRRCPARRLRRWRGREPRWIRREDSGRRERVAGALNVFAIDQTTARFSALPGRSSPRCRPPAV